MLEFLPLNKREMILEFDSSHQSNQPDELNDTFFLNHECVFLKLSLLFIYLYFLLRFI